MVSTTDSIRESAAPRRKPLKVHPFMPAVMHKPRIIRWLKRFHAWFGVFGAVAGMIFAWSGFMLNHRTDFRVGADIVTTESTLPAPETRTFSSADEFGLYVKEQLDLFGQPRAPAMGVGIGMGAIAVPGGPAIESPAGFQASFVAASDQVAASYTVGSEVISITRQDRPPIRTLNRMHLGQAPNIGWQIVNDMYSGALIFLCLSGILIWSRLDGSRLVGLTLISTSFGLVIYWMLIGP